MIHKKELQNIFFVDDEPCPEEECDKRNFCFNYRILVTAVSGY